METKIKIWLWLMRLGAKSGCHQRPERSFFVRGFQFPVCARCTGILVGYISAVLLYRYITAPYCAYLVLTLPMAIDGGTQYMKWRESSQPLRFITGVMGGYGLLSVQINILIRLIG